LVLIYQGDSLDLLIRRRSPTGCAMVAQGLLGFQYERERCSGGLTSLAGLPMYLELIVACGLAAAIRQHLHVAGEQGWLDLQMVLAVVFLNLAGGDCVADVDRLQSDAGFVAVMTAIERELLTRKERRMLKARWRRPCERAVPSRSALSGWLERFADPYAPPAEAGTAVIPQVTAQLQGLWRANQALLEFLQRKQPSASATLDMDATVIATHKREALYCYKGFKAYQPLNCWWAEQQVMLYSEFRDGNVPAGYEQLRVLQDSLSYLPASVKKVSLRSDSAGFQQDILLYCGEGKDPRFGVIEFAVSADVTEAFRAAVLAVAESEWKPLIRTFDGKLQQTGQEWAEVCYVPDWAGHSRKRADYRIPGDPRTAAPAGTGRSGQHPAVAVPDPEFRPQGHLQAVRRGDQSQGRRRQGYLVAARALRQKRRSSRGDEKRPGRRTIAVRSVRRQRRLVGVDDPHPQPQQRDEAAGLGQGLGAEPDEGAALPSDRPGGPRGAPRPPADHPPRRSGRGDSDAHTRP
jgi:hypothetical protein